MMLSDIRDYIAGLDMAEQCYMGKLDAKKDNIICGAVAAVIYHWEGAATQPMIFCRYPY